MESKVRAGHSRTFQPLSRVPKVPRYISPSLELPSMPTDPLPLGWTLDGPAPPNPRSFAAAVERELDGLEPQLLEVVRVLAQRADLASDESSRSFLAALLAEEVRAVTGLDPVSRHRFLTLLQPSVPETPPPSPLTMAQARELWLRLGSFYDIGSSSVDLFCFRRVLHRRLFARATRRV